MAKNKTNNGKLKRLSWVEIFLIVATLFVLGFVGYAVYQAATDVEEMPQEEQTQSAEESSPDEGTDVLQAPNIESSEDLDAALEVMDEADLESANESLNELEDAEGQL